MLETALATSQENEALLGSIDMTPTFSIDLPGGVATAFPLCSYSLPAFDTRGSLAVLECGATSIASFRPLSLYLNWLLDPMNQTLIHSASQMWVVPVAPRRAEVIGDFEPWTPSIAEDPQSPAQSALAAVTDIQRWLAVGQDQVAALAGYAPRSVKNWREGMDPYPSTVRRLFDLRALLGSLTQRLGVEGARLWLADASRTGIRRRDLIADDTGLRSVISEASTTLFERPTVPSMHELDFDEEMHTDAPQQPDLFSGPIRRARRRK